MSAETEFRINSSPRSPRLRRLLPVMIGVAAVAMFAGALPAAAQADGITNPFFKAQGSQPALSGWQSSGTASQSYIQSQNMFCDFAYCQMQSGAPAAIAGIAGSPAPLQTNLLGTAGNPGHSFRYKATAIDSQSNFAMVFGGCAANNTPDTGRLWQSFDATEGDVLTGFSFFSSADWWPDSGAVTITAPDGSEKFVFRAEIADGQAPAGPWDHPVPGTPNNRPDLIGQSGTGWVGWNYMAEQTGTYKVEVTSSNAQDCNGPSAIGLQFPTPNPIKKGQTIDFAPQDKTYGDPAFDVTGTAVDARTDSPTGLPVTFSSSSPGVCSVDASGHVAILGAGDCNITASVPGDGTYAARSITKTAHVDRAWLSIDADDQSKQYGAADPNLTYGFSGFVNGDGQGSANISGNANCSIDSAAGPNAGAYGDAISCAPGSLSAANYMFQPGLQGTLTITKADQTIDFSVPSGMTFGDSDLDPGATASSELPVSYSSSTPSVCTIVGGKIHVVAPGDCTVTAAQAGSGNYNQAQDVTRTLAVGKAPQAIDLSVPSSKTFGAADFDPVAIASSGLPVSYSSSTPTVCTIVAGKVHIVGAGDCTITASQPGNTNYQAAQDVSGTFAVAKADQTVDLPAPSAKTYGDADLDPGATASSGLPVSYSSSTPSVCTIVAGKVHVVGAGDCTITASQAGSGNYNGAADVSKTFTVGKAPLSVNAGDASKQYGGDDPALTSGLSGFVNGDDQGSANISGDADCSIDDAAGPNAGSYPGAIVCDPGTLSAANYSFQTGTPGALTITKADQAVDFSAPSGMTFGDSDLDLGATASSGLAVSYSSSTPGVCTISGGQVHVVGAGDCTITASQAGSGNFNAAPGVTKTFAVAKADQTIAMAAAPAMTAGDSDLELGATASSGLPVSYTSSTPSVCTIVNGKVHVVAAGECTIAASQEGNGNYDVADSVSITFTVAKADQAVSFSAPTGKTVTSPDFDPGATTSSLLGLTYTSSTPSVCTIVNGKVHILATGDCTITASQSGNLLFNAAQDVTRTFTVAQAATKQNQSISFSTPSSKTAGAADFDPGATASSGLPVSYSTSTPSVCTIVSGKVHIVGAGTCTVTASQGGSATYNAAQSVTRSFSVSKANQTINFTPPSGKTVGDADFDPGATASSGLPVSYSSSTPSVCTIVNGKVHIVGSGTCSLTASQAGNSSYNSAQSVCRSFTVVKRPPPTVTITTPADGGSYFEGQSVQAAYACQAAAGVTLTSCVGSVQVGSPVDTSDPGTESFTVTAKDSAGNQTKKTVTYTVIGVSGCRHGGSFVIGDRNASVGSKVTFWGSQWSKQNSLSGGSAPSSFKGFAESPDDNPWHWHGSWTSRTGNSSDDPPDSVPTYMAVIVASDVRQSRSSIGGDQRKVVVVKTDSGYDSNPGHAGTGTVVATLGD